ncbi:MAG: hypothetical protein PHP00_01480 [Thiotrichaceae bacterium]|nr:hypothetical protein [Thiotrichaceae bacterium]
MMEEDTGKMVVTAVHSSQPQDHASIQGKIAAVDRSPDAIIDRLPANSLTRRLFPSKIAKHLQRYELEAIMIETDFRKSVLQVARNAQLQAIDEMYQDFIQKGKAKVQVDRQKVFVELMQEAQKHLEQQISIFAETVAKATERLESVRKISDKLAQKEEERIANMINRFYEVFDEYPNRLQEILNTNLTR